MGNEQVSQNIGQSIVAVIAGLVVGYILTRITDSVLHKVGFFPAVGEWIPSTALAVAIVYRGVYSIFSGYIVALIAPNRPVKHALISGAIGMIPTVMGTFLTWNSNLGAHWYPLVLIVISLPCAWAGGRLRIVRFRTVSSIAS